MQLTRTVSRRLAVVMLVFGGFVAGCGEDQGTSKPPPDPATSKKIAEETKNAMKEGQRARAAAKGGRR